METNQKRKRVYLVRHGQTVGNISQHIQGLLDPLTEKGEEQATFLGERFRTIPFEKLFASDALRAQETAKRIGQATGHDVETTTLLREVPYPSTLEGLDRTDSRIISYWAEQYKIREDLDWKHSDEESFHELCVRADNVLELFKNESTETMTAVCHGHFMKIIIGRLLYGDAFDIACWLRIISFLSMSNTGITVLEWDGTVWRMLTWNDHAHLG